MVALLQQIAAKFPGDVGKALYAEAQIEVTEMKRICPVDVSPGAPHPGNLRASIHAEKPEVMGRIIRVIIATGKQAPYAVYVHEDPDAIHPVGEWKFMENPLKASAPDIAGRVAKRLQIGAGSSWSYGDVD